MGFPSVVVKNMPANSGDAGLIPGLGRSPGVENGNPLQYSCLENSVDRGAQDHKELDTVEQLSTYIVHHTEEALLNWVLPF